MGLIGSAARLSYITAYRIDLNTREMQLRNQAMLIENQMAQEQSSNNLPTLDQFKTSTDSTSTSTSSTNNDAQAQQLYQQALQQYNSTSVKNQQKITQLSSVDKMLQTQITQIETQLKALDAEEQQVQKRLDDSVKRSFGASA